MSVKGTSKNDVVGRREKERKRIAGENRWRKGRKEGIQMSSERGNNGNKREKNEMRWKKIRT